VKLAAGEGLSPGSIAHHMKLIQPAEAIHTKLMELTKAEDVHCYGLNRMKAIADLLIEK
jgi:hypothetical protein